MGIAACYHERLTNNSPLNETNPMQNRTSQSVLVTGATGFIGHHLVPELIRQGCKVNITGMERSNTLESLGARWFDVGDISGDTDWTSAMEGVEAVIHLAGIAHRFESSTRNDWDLYDRVNHQGTRSLIRDIRSSKTVKHLVFMSTIRVHGDAKEMPITTETPLDPVTPYDRSKADAEKAIWELLGPQAVHWAIFRPVLVYGPGNRGNLAKLESLIKAGLPVPITRQPNQKSFVFVGNLVEAMIRFMQCPDIPSGQAWLLRDPGISSTEKLVSAMAKAMKRPVRFARLPRSIYFTAAKAGDRLKRMGLPFPWTSETAGKLLGDFYISPDLAQAPHLCDMPFSLEDGIEATYKALEAIKKHLGIN